MLRPASRLSREVHFCHFLQAVSKARLDSGSMGGTFPLCCAGFNCPLDFMEEGG